MSLSLEKNPIISTIPNEIWHKIVYYLNNKDLLNFIKFILQNFRSNNYRKFYIKSIILASINKQKINKLIFKSYLNITTTNNYIDYINRSSIHLCTGSLDYKYTHKVNIVYMKFVNL